MRVLASDPAVPRDDTALLAAYQAGDERAATELVRRHTQGLARYLVGLGALAADVDDLLQEAFFRAFRAAGSFRGGGASFRSWLYRIATNVARDQHRRRRNRVVLSLAEHDLAGEADPEGEADAAAAEDRLQEALRRLPAKQREVFLLRAQQAISYQEIAQVLGTTPGAARVHYHHAVKRLKEAMR